MRDGGRGGLGHGIGIVIEDLRDGGRGGLDQGIRIAELDQLDAL